MLNIADIESIAKKLGKARKSGDEYLCQCPAHDDKNPSLSIGLSENGQPLVYCHAGCSQDQVIKALKNLNLWPSNTGHSKDKPIIEYEYRDENGELCYTIKRTPDKRFFITPSGTKKRILYRLPELLKAKKKNELIFFVEGEKDVDTLRAYGLNATTNPFGAGAPFLESYSETLSGCNVVVIPDNDRAGKNHALNVCTSLLGKALSLKYLELQGLEEKDDVSDWLLKGGSKERLLELVENTPECTTESLDILRERSQEWDEPKPLQDITDPLPYPIDSLPEILREGIKDVQKMTQAPVPLIAASALSVISTTCQAHYDIRRGQGLKSPISLFMLTIAESGERKSTCDKLFTSVIRDYERQEQEKLKQTIKECHAKIASWESKELGIKKDITEKTKKGNDTKELEEKLLELQNNKPEFPRIPKLIRKDETPESLAYGLKHEWPTCGILSSEGGSILGSHANSSDTVMRNLSLQNELWDGEGLSIGRRTSESYSVNDVRLTVGIQIQEEPLKQFIERSKGLARGIGYFSRFLISIPVSTQGTRFYKEIDTPLDNLELLKARLFDILNKAIFMNDDGSLSPEALDLSHEAKELWKSFYNETEKELSCYGKYADMKDVASKAGDNAARLSALFHLVSDTSGSLIIEKESMAGAIACMKWYLNEALRFFGFISLSKEDQTLKKLDSWIIKYCRDYRVHSFPKTIALQCSPSQTRKKEQLETAMNTLSQLNRARIDKVNGKDSIIINPKLLKQ
jgi:hypothetical protein